MAETAVQICEYHGRTFVWTRMKDGWSRGGHWSQERLSLAQAEEVDGPLTPMDYIGTAPQILAELAALRQQLDEARAEIERLRGHILDIDAHATPFGDIPDEPGWVGTYLVTAGALHRALGKIGHTAPSCTAEADRDRPLVVYRAAEAWAGAIRLLVEIDGDHLSQPSRDLLAALDSYYRSTAPAEPGAAGSPSPAPAGRSRPPCRSTPRRPSVADQDRQKAIVERMLVDLAALVTEDTGSELPVCTNWVLVAEWATVDGQQYVSRFFDSQRPEWQRDGLLRHALKDWGRDD